MNPFAIVSDLRVQDLLDILFLTVLTYHLYLWFWGTKAFKALVGLLALGLVFTAARSWGLFLTTWVFQILWQVLVVLLIILFQSEIRQVLEKVNPLKMIGLRAFSRSPEWISGFVTGIFSLAKRKIGALVIVERTDLVDEMVTGGTPLECEPSPEALMSVFQKDSPLHDGAMLIRNGKVVRVACYLPLSSAEGLPKEWGTRHRAALGLSERCDAAVLVASEERGEVSMVQEGEVKSLDSPAALSNLIMEAVTKTNSVGKNKWEKARVLIMRQWKVKLGTLALVSFFWLLLAGQQNFEVSFKVPLELKNVPQNMEILEPVNPSVQLTVRGLRKDSSTLNSRNVHAELDLALVRFGKRVFRITRDQIELPNDRVYLVHIDPPQIEFKAGGEAQHGFPSASQDGL